MKRQPINHSHEIWHVCTCCGVEFDKHLHGNACPECGTVSKVNYLSGTIIFSAIIFWVIIALLFTSCGITKKYGYRHHRNTVAQKVLQYEHCRPYRFGEWKACQHFNERPKNHWPLRD